MTGPHRQMLDSQVQIRNEILKATGTQMQTKVLRQTARIPTALLVADVIW